MIAPCWIAPCAVHVDAADPAAALPIVTTLFDRLDLAVAGVRAVPYRKIGPHCRVTFFLIFPGGTDETALVARLDAVADAILAPSHRAAGHRNRWRNDDGSTSYEIILDRRTSPFRATQVNWVDLEINTCAAAQDDLRRTVRSLRRD